MLLVYIRIVPVTNELGNLHWYRTCTSTCTIERHSIGTLDTSVFLFCSSSCFPGQALAAVKLYELLNLIPVYLHSPNSNCDVSGHEVPKRNLHKSFNVGGGSPPQRFLISSMFKSATTLGVVCREKSTDVRKSICTCSGLIFTTYSRTEVVQNLKRCL